MNKITRWLHKQGGVKVLAWTIVGYTLMTFCTVLFSASLALGKPTAAAKSAIFCFVLALALGWHREK